MVRDIFSGYFLAPMIRLNLSCTFLSIAWPVLLLIINCSTQHLPCTRQTWEPNSCQESFLQHLHIQTPPPSKSRWVRPSYPLPELRRPPSVWENCSILSTSQDEPLSSYQSYGTVSWTAWEHRKTYSRRNMVPKSGSGSLWLLPLHRATQACRPRI